MRISGINYLVFVLIFGMHFMSNFSKVTAKVLDENLQKFKPVYSEGLNGPFFIVGNQLKEATNSAIDQYGLTAVANTSSHIGSGEYEADIQDEALKNAEKNKKSAKTIKSEGNLSFVQVATRISQQD